jgi:molybdopterin synthase sulfur carrier subunit
MSRPVTTRFPDTGNALHDTQQRERVNMIQLRYFADLREQLGIGDETVALPAHVDTVAGLQRWLQGRGEPWSGALADERLLVAVNHAVAKHDTGLRDGDEIAWFPPVSGG